MELSSNTKLFATGGIVLGMYFSIKSEKNIPDLLKYALLFGIAGGLIGTMADKVFESPYTNKQ